MVRICFKESSGGNMAEMGNYRDKAKTTFELIIGEGK